ncbi:MAG: GNAT family N-acetyltransferase [Marinomonas sp.]|jgi:ElaA protein|uniref:GNAT family N-acetyltransferase n=1 Tax=Marinomonas TaxID=28253 RepID=UPI00105448E6|nr:GNAT family N-acetyltransferase [Marinomonas sp. KMM3893]
MNWYCRKFHELSVDTLYDLLKLRSNVFVVEQNCPYPDLDDLDRLPDTQHLYAVQEGHLIAYARLLPVEASYPLYSSIGRVVVAPNNRKDKLGHALIEQAINQTLTLWPNIGIKIGAQSHLENFYASHGFVTVSKPYLEDGIEHISMLRE